MALKRAHLGDSAPELVASLNSLAIVVERRGDKKRAIALYGQAYELAARVLRKNHPTTAQVAYNLAALNFEAKDLATAARYCKAALDGRMTSLGPHPPNTQQTRQLCTAIARKAGP